ncbi:predicted protein [Chaetomium globosum CBS 148.51]|uniref:Heterokaryon incompatibility domain-containing protein n=1 Tax=Chaetomium globosum (strain ATCC 6205 / CBS 148.51 / DSM 1962 / NBRC 6347 / NRRL 1970) TaxID=306901 RepID=Q2H7B6_CHAGB|nr:uncharacterized protein CHGG_05449 [Chaetomium globosum CBS 148.51]EAQ88830.1 predicted protein [Chaetomium globosum CBS 148.51]
MAEDLTPHRTIPNDYNSYHPLRSEHHEIRLLRVLPGGDDDELAVVLVRSNRSNHPEYRALSYCWGSLNELAPVTVVFEDDRDVDSSSILDVDEPCGVLGPRAVTFQITTNLHDALASFRRTREHGYLWIDMLCINQGDVESGRGSWPIGNWPGESWPGESWQDSFLGKERLRRFYDFLSNPRLHVSVEDAPPGFDHALHTYRSRIATSSSEVWDWSTTVLTRGKWMVAALPRDMFRRMAVIAKAPWFRRVWVIQEVAAANRVRVRVADAEGSWEIIRSLRNFVSELFARIVAEEPTALASLDFGGHDLIPALWQDLVTWQDANTMTIVKLVEALRTFFATDPRDLDAGRETYARFTSSVIRSTGHLDILSMAKFYTRPERPAGLPGWTPDFSYRPPKDWDPMYNRGRWDQPFGRTLARMKDTNSWKTLQVAGIYEARVATIIDAQVVVDSRDGKGLDSKKLRDVPLQSLWACVNEAYAKTFLARGRNDHQPARPSSLTLT